jgi:hypothetical protein
VQKPDRIKASSLIKQVRFVIVDGYHRFNALKELQKEKFAGLPKLVWCDASKILLFSKNSKVVICYSQVNCQVLTILTEMEQFVFSERCNHTNHDGTVALTIYDRLTQVKHLRMLRYVCQPHHDVYILRTFLKMTM